MNVKELIDKLKELPEDAIVKTWDPYRDEETETILVSTDNNGSTVWIMNTTIGYKPI